MATHRSNVEILREMLQPKFDRRIAEGHPNWFPYTRVQRPSSSKLDSEMKDQLHKKEKNPQFGIERYLYRIQEQLLEVIGPNLLVDRPI